MDSKRNRPTHYEVLGVAPTADASEIQKRYRRLALEHHPDRNVGREEAAKAAFQPISEAYQTLMDPEKRLTYDSQHNLNFTGRVAELARRAKAAGSASRGTAAQSQATPAPAPPTLATNAADEDDDDEEYSPEYIGAGSSSASAGISTVEIGTLPGRPQLLVQFMLRRDHPTQPLGLLLERRSMKVGQAVEDTAAFGAGIPVGAVLVRIGEHHVASPEDVIERAAGELNVVAMLQCDVQLVRVRRSSLLHPVEAIPNFCDAVSDDPEALRFAQDESGAVCKLAVSAADGCMRLAAAGAAESLVGLGGNWLQLRGRRLLTVAGLPVAPLPGWEDTPQLAPESVAAVASALEGDAVRTPAVLFRRRHFIDLVVLCDAATAVPADEEDFFP